MFSSSGMGDSRKSMLEKFEFQSWIWMCKHFKMLSFAASSPGFAVGDCFSYQSRLRWHCQVSCGHHAWVPCNAGAPWRLSLCTNAGCSPVMSSHPRWCLPWFSSLFQVKRQHSLFARGSTNGCTRMMWALQRPLPSFNACRIVREKLRLVDYVWDWFIKSRVACQKGGTECS